MVRATKNEDMFILVEEVQTKKARKSIFGIYKEEERLEGGTGKKEGYF